MRRPACVIGMCLLAVIRLLLFIRPPDTSEYRWIDGKRTEAVGTVDDKYIKNNTAYLIIRHPIIKSFNIRISDKNIKVKLKNEYGELSGLPAIGSEVTVTGRAMAFMTARNPGNFDQAQYELIHGNAFEIYDASLGLAPIPHDRIFVREGMCLIRDSLSKTADSIYGEEDSQIVKAMALGDRTGLSADMTDLYRRAGMSHVLCISGLHISLLGAGLINILCRLGVKKKYANIAAVLFSVMYGLLTGMSISAVRAILMFILNAASGYFRRTPDLISSLSHAGAAVMVIRPLYVLDAGFTLSFTAVAGIGILSESMKLMLPDRERMSRLTESLRTSLSVTVFMLPMNLYYFYSVAVFAIPINLIVIPLLGILLSSALLSVTAAMCFRPLGMLIAIPARLILNLYGKLTELTAGSGFSELTVGRPTVLQIALFYTGIFLLTWCTARHRAGSYRAGSKQCLWFYGGLILSVLMLVIRIHAPLTVTMIDVGQGDCHYMRFPDGMTMMIDCGSSDVRDVARYRVVPYLRSEGIERIDYAVVTHFDDDHINGYREMLNDGGKLGIDIGTFIVPDIETEDEACRMYAKQAAESGVNIIEIHAGEYFDIAGVRFKCLNPAEGVCYDDTNAASVCLDIHYKGFKALYTGDVQGAGEDILMRNIKKDDYTLLKCAHHGSRYSTPEELLKLVRPELTLISAGVGNSYGHPHEELLQRLSEAKSRIYVTADTGAVILETNGEKLKIKIFLQQ